MKKQYMRVLPLLTLMMAWSACEDFVTGIDPLIDQVEDEQLNRESEVPFIIVGLETQFGETHDELMMIADLLSDQLYFSRKIKGASYSTYEKIDNGVIDIDNSSSAGPETEVGRLRFYGDDLVKRVDKIDFSSSTLRSTALFKGYLYGGIARYYYATYYGLTENQGGGVIDGGEFIPSDAMYDLAIEKFESALEHTEDAATIRMVNSLIARCYLFKADYANARTAAQAGMVSGDGPFQALHNAEDDPNYYWEQAGNGRRQAAAPTRFHDYVTADPIEANRVLLEEVLGTDRSTIYSQAKYPLPETGVNLISWQENELMLAELNLRSGDAAGCLTKINNVRASHGIADLASADMSVLIEERDKELFVTGIRLVDQRRFDADYQTWHLDADAWKYLPISDNERNANENID